MNVRGAPLHLASEPGEPSDLMARLGVALMGARDLDEVARRLLAGLSQLPGIHRVGLALSEGAGRRLRFLASDSVSEGPLDWCHIDAYDDVPLTTVVRTGEAIIGGRSEVDRRFATFMSQQPEAVQGFAAVPLPGTGSPIGALIIYLERAWEPSGQGRRLLDSVASHAADAVRRLRTGQGRDASPGEADVAARARRLVLPDDPRSVGRARRSLGDFLTEADAGVSGDALDTAALCLSELATNALMHGDGTFEVRMTLDRGLLTVAVRDQGAPQPVPEARRGEDDPLEVYGRGLQLVEAFADRWGSERDAHGLMVWFALDVESASSEAAG